MLLRIYRLTDKIGLVILKLFVLVGEFLLEGVGILFGGFRGGLFGSVLMLWRLLKRFTKWIVRLFQFIWRLLVGTVRQVFQGVGFLANLFNRGAKAASGNAQSAKRVMVRRSERAEARREMEVGYVEDPLRQQNRLLSQLVIVFGFALLGVILWSTSNRNTTPVIAPVDSNITFQQPNADVTPTIVSLVNTPVPTATPIPAILQVRGSIAYVARENGQTDIWAVDVGGSNPVRIVNNVADDRDPAWSPDGQQLAYASRQDGNWELYVYNLLTNETTRLTYDLSFQANPSWSPDGTYIVYESYQGENLDLYIMPIDGSAVPIRITENAAPDFSPSWSPDGRQIAFVSWRDGNQDIYVFSLDNPTEDALINLTNTPNRDEDYPSWSPDGDLIAFSALDEGIEKVFVKSVSNVSATAQVLERGHTPTWSPDGTSLVFAVESIDSAHLVASPFTQAGVATEIIPVLSGSLHPVWTSAPLPVSLVNDPLPSAVSGSLYVEQEIRADSDPPYRLDTLVGVDAPNPVLSDRVNNSFNALREQALAAIGYDFLGELEDAFWRIDRPPQPGEERRNWHMTGRAFSVNRNLIAGFPPPIEVVREDIGVNTYWRMYIRVADEAQNGQLGEPLRRMPWDFASRNQGDVQAYDQGGRIRDAMPTGYYIDLTQLAQDYDWERVPAGRDWRANFNSINFWMFAKTDGLTWYEAMREIYTEAQLGGFVPTATPPPVVNEQG